MRFKWDEYKRRSNAAKHGIDLADCERVFDGPTISAEDRKSDYGEQRFLAFGWLDEYVVAISYTYRSEDEIRIISMRRATPYERKKFLERFSH
jgi:uncharacterized DUF497 family protein